MLYLMPMGPNVIQHKSNDGLAINKQNGISNATHIGKLLDAAHATRPDILYAAVMMAQFAKNPSQEDWTGVKRYLRYPKETIDFALTCRLWRTLETRAMQMQLWNKSAPQINQWLYVHNRLGEPFRGVQRTNQSQHIMCKPSHIAYSKSHLP
jgi:hypothetical protein